MVLPFNIALYSGMSGAMSGASGYDTDAQAYFDAIVTNGGSISTANQGYVNTLVEGLKTDGIFSKLLFLYLFAAENSVCARVNVKNPSVLATAVNSPTFVAYQGYDGDGATAYVATGYIGTDLTPTNAMFGVRLLQESSNRAALMGYRAARGTLLHGLGAVQGFLHSSTISSHSATLSDDDFVALHRTGTTQAIWLNASPSVVSVTATDSTLNNTNAINAFLDSSSYHDGRIGAAFAGQYLTDSEFTNFKSRIDAYMTSIGAT